MFTAILIHGKCTKSLDTNSTAISKITENSTKVTEMSGKKSCHRKMFTVNLTSRLGQHQCLVAHGSSITVYRECIMLHCHTVITVLYFTIILSVCTAWITATWLGVKQSREMSGSFTGHPVFNDQIAYCLFLSYFIAKYFVGLATLLTRYFFFRLVNVLGKHFTLISGPFASSVPLPYSRCSKRHPAIQQLSNSLQFSGKKTPSIYTMRHNYWTPVVFIV